MIRNIILVMCALIIAAGLYVGSISQPVPNWSQKINICVASNNMPSDWKAWKVEMNGNTMNFFCIDPEEEVEGDKADVRITAPEVLPTDMQALGEDLMDAFKA